MAGITLVKHLGNEDSEAVNDAIKIYANGPSPIVH